MFFKFTVKNTVSNSIPQLGILNTSKAEKNCCRGEPEYLDDNSQVEYQNSPMVTWICDDHEQKCKLVYVALPIISGSTDISFEIADDGNRIFINYTWPMVMFNPEELFANEIKTAISSNHPKIHTLTSHLLSIGITKKSKPRGKIAIDLPIQVQREVESWKKKAVICPDGTKVCILEFKAFQEEPIIKFADTSLCFD